jgi:putative zinc finger/helix-turn-helix YgiT family protein
MPRKHGRAETETPRPCDRPFPRRCPECGKAEVQPATIAYDAEVKHDGRLHAFHIPRLHVNQCAACDEVLFSNLTDDQISQALREHLTLLSPKQIHDSMSTLGLRQKDLAERIGVAAETVSRWMSGTHIQSRAMDNLMRLFFAFDAVRTALASPHPDKNLGVKVADRAASQGICGAGATGGGPRGTSQADVFTRAMRPLATVHPRFSRTFSQDILRRQRSFLLVPSRN